MSFTFGDPAYVGAAGGSALTPPAMIQSAQMMGTNPQTLTLTGTVAGSLILGFLAGTTISTFAPGAPWTTVVSNASGLAAARGGLLSRVSPGGSVSLTTTGSSSNVSIVLAEFSHASETSPVVVYTADDGVVHADIGLGPVAAPAGLLVGWASSNNTIPTPSVDLGMSLIPGTSRLKPAWKAVAAGTYSPTITLGGSLRRSGGTVAFAGA